MLLEAEEMILDAEVMLLAIEVMLLLVGRDKSLMALALQ